jgi:hypothetical protein
MENVGNNPNYVSYKKGWKLKILFKIYSGLLKWDSEEREEIEELIQFQNIVLGYKIIIMYFPVMVLYFRKIQIFQTNCTSHMNLRTSTMMSWVALLVHWPRDMCNDHDLLYDYNHECGKVCNVCSADPPRIKSGTKYCKDCNRICLSEECWRNHKLLKVRN